MQNNFVLNHYGRAYGSREQWEKSILCINRLHLPVCGGAIYRDTNGELDLAPEHLYFLPNSFAANFELKQKGVYDHLFIDFQTFPPILGTQPVDIDLSKDDFVKSLTKAWDSVIKSYTAQSSAQTKQVSAILEMLVRHLRVKYGVSTVENKKIEQAILFIEEHYTEPIGNDDIARALHIDNRHLIRLFGKYMHMPPYQYLTQCRIEHALTELRRGKTAAETAELCGYLTENAFRIAFKKTMGCPPGEFMRKIFYERI